MSSNPDVSYPKKANVILHAKIISVDDTQCWFFNECTGCQGKIEIDNQIFRCGECKRRIPHPEKRLYRSLITKKSYFLHTLQTITQINFRMELNFRFTLRIRASDQTDTVDIELEDREIRILTGKRAEEVIKQVKQSIFHFTD